MKDSALLKKKTVEKKTKVSKPEEINLTTQSVYLIPILFLFIILLVLSVINILVKQNIADYTVDISEPVNLSDYPILDDSLAPVITAESAIILDDTSKVILYEKKPQLRFSMASTTKIMTAIVALEHFKPNDIITIQSLQTEGAIAGFEVGEKIRFEDILYALLLPSANDAALAIAENYPGGVKSFVDHMNNKAADLSLKYTHYADPAGLDDDGNYTTVNDLSQLSSYAINNPGLAKIIATKRKVISTVDGSKSYTLINLNKLLGIDGIVGIKTGFTQGAGEVLVTAKAAKGHRFIIIVMKSEDRFADTEILSKIVNDNVKFIKPADFFFNNQ